ncbi:hypothetical protein ABZ942_37690 [Nocardia sp. NPDC046473]|uniref:hypothetical protein n=1 Tax=Nocardia sp. NPDC046473 TaxID=3155733 RepID=UPI003400AA4B
MAVPAELWSCYTDVIAGRSPERPYPVSIEALLAERGIEKTAGPGGGTCILSTYGGRLSIEIHHLGSTAAQQQRRADSYAAELRGVIS